MQGLYQLPQYGSGHEQRVAVFIYVIVRDATSIRNDQTKRSAIRRNGRLTFDVSGKHIPGPFTIQARQEILDRLLAVQAEFGAQL
ncbi:MAG: hypothetical protein JSS01_01555, partial [Proteobacteria bacterium]|nr:hypothetical protein [Pseudomonadota bacterium]